VSLSQIERAADRNMRLSHWSLTLIVLTCIQSSIDVLCGKSCSAFALLELPHLLLDVFIPYIPITFSTLTLLAGHQTSKYAVKKLTINN